MFRARQITSTLAIVVLALSAFAQENSFSGRWTAILKKGDRTGTATLNMSISGTGVTGTLSDPSGQVWQIENGKLEDSQLTFECLCPGARRQEEHSLLRSGGRRVDYPAQRVTRQARPDHVNSPLQRVGAVRLVAQNAIAMCETECEQV